MRNVAFGVERTCGLGVLCGSLKEGGWTCDVRSCAIRDLVSCMQNQWAGFPRQKMWSNNVSKLHTYRVLPLEGKRLVVIDKIAVLPC